MLEQKDLQAIRSIMTEEIVKSESNMKSVFSEEITKSESNMKSIISEEIAKSEKHSEARLKDEIAKLKSEMKQTLTTSENLILDETERTRSILEEQMAKVQENMDELKQYYRITKLESDNTAVLLKLIDELSKRVEKLEKKTA